MLFKLFNNNNTTKGKRDKNKYKRKKNIGNNISDILFCYNIMDIYIKKTIQKINEKNSN